MAELILEPKTVIVPLFLKKGTKISEIKRAIRAYIREELKKNKNFRQSKQLEIELTLSPPCACPSTVFTLAEIPLEDLTCRCGKVYLFKYYYY